MDRKIVLVVRPTRLAELVARFNTVAQAKFYIEHLGADFTDYQKEDETYRNALVHAQEQLISIARLQTINREFLPNFLFGPDDVIVTIGQDGLVANTLKYLSGQQVIGVNPDPARWDGKLLPFEVKDIRHIVPEVLTGKRPTKVVTMAKAELNNTQTLFAVNDFFIGPKTHTSARYIIQSGKVTETQSSSGVIVSTGFGSSGWLKSVLTGAASISQSVGSGLMQQSAQLLLPVEKQKRATARPQLNITSEFPWNADYLCFTVREPFPTRTTGASLVFGHINSSTPLLLTSQMAENGVIFSDGIEKDFLEFNSGTTARITIAERNGVLVV
ncbi:MAG: sugar kinase [Limisphaerales bacterium]